MIDVTDEMMTAAVTAFVDVEGKARPASLRAACEGIADDYMTSENHHPGYVLIPTAKFEAIRAALATEGKDDG
jgi:hypothetical protein